MLLRFKEITSLAEAVMDVQPLKFVSNEYVALESDGLVPLPIIEFEVVGTAPFARTISIVTEPDVPLGEIK